MRIALGLDTDGALNKTIERARRLRERGFTSLWSSQIFGPDTLTVLAIVGRELPDVDFGTAVVPIQPRHPAMLAAQARTVEEAIGGHLTLGIGLSHQIVVEALWGLSFDRPATYMREYVEALAPMLRGETVATHGERVKVLATSALGPKDVTAPSLIIAALGPKMLTIAGSLADGTATWLTGPKTIAEHVVPRLSEAAAAANRPAPRVVAALPMCVTGDVAGARERLNEEYAIYATLPSYAKMMEREGAPTVADVSLIGDHDHVLEAVHGLAAAGVTEFSAAPSGDADEREGAIEVLLEYQRATSKSL